MTLPFFRDCGLAGLVALAGFAANAQDAQEFHDDFQGNALSPAFRALNPDNQRMAMTRGEYLLLVTHPEIKNVIEYAGPLPPEYEVAVRLAQPPENRGQFFRIRIGDHTDNVRLGASVDNNGYLRLWTDRVLNSEDLPRSTFGHPELLGPPVYLRFRNLGVEYEGQFSTDGVKWTSLGSQVRIGDGARLHLEAGASGRATESPVNIDSFEIRGF